MVAGQTDRDTWRQPSRQVLAAAAVGAVVAAVDVGILDTALRIDRSSCVNPGVACPGAARGQTVAVLVMVAGTLIGFALLRIRPLAGSVVACVYVVYLAVPGTSAAVPGSQETYAWTAIPLATAGYALVAAAFVMTGRGRIVAVALLAALVAGAVLVHG